jgi:hypothetical protein
MYIVRGIDIPSIELGDTVELSMIYDIPTSVNPEVYINAGSGFEYDGSFRGDASGEFIYQPTTIEYKTQFQVWTDTILVRLTDISEDDIITEFNPMLYKIYEPVEICSGLTYSTYRDLSGTHLDSYIVTREQLE